jgi:hypothetical protein
MDSSPSDPLMCECDELSVHRTPHARAPCHELSVNPCIVRLTDESYAVLHATMQAGRKQLEGLSLDLSLSLSLSLYIYIYIYIYIYNII